MRFVRLFSAMVLFTATLAVTAALPSDAAVSVITRSNGIVDVNGDNSADVVGICETGGVIQIHTSAGVESLPVGTRTIRVNLRGGDDSLTLGPEVCGGSMELPLDFRVILGSGNDSLDLQDLTIGRNMIVLGQAGEETVWLSGVSAARLTLNTSSGASTVDISNSTFGRVSARGGTGIDAITATNSDLGRNPSFFTSAGNDGVTLDLPSATGRVTMNLGTGDDTATVIDPNNCTRSDCVEGLETGSNYLLNVIMGGGTDVTRAELDLRPGDRLNGGAGNADRLEFFSPGGATINGYEFFGQISGNNPPTANDDSFTAISGETELLDVLTNDTDPDFDPLMVTEINGQPILPNETILTNNGEVAMQFDGSLLFTSDPEWDGTEIFGYTISDGNGGTDMATVAVEVSFPNVEPTAVDDFENTDFETAVDIPVLANDSDPELGPLTVSQIQSTPVSDGDSVPVPNGSAELLASGEIRFTPAADFSGVTQFTYTAIDDESAAATGTVTVTVGDRPNTPAIIGGDLTGTAIEDSGTPLNGLVVVTDPDPGEDALQANTGIATYGNFTIDATGSWSYDLDDTNPTVDALNVGDTVSDSFTITSIDGTNAIVNITINGENDNPIAVDDEATTDEDVPLTIPGATLTANDSDVDSTNLTVTDVTDGALGTASVNSGDVLYIPNVDASGTDTITYTVRDDKGEADTANVTITINPTNDTATIGGDLTGTAIEDSGVTISGLATVTDPDPGEDGFQADTGTATYGNFTIDAAGSWSYDLDDTNPTVDALNVGDTVSDSFTITSIDGTNAIVNITINGENDNPVAVDDTDGTDEDETIVITGVTLTANDSDVDSTNLTVTEVTDGTLGTASVVAGDVVYMPAADVSGTDTITYTVRDGDGGIATADIVITISPTDDTAIIGGDLAGTAIEDSGVPTVGLATVIDPDPGENLFAAEGNPTSYGSYLIDASGNWTYDLDDTNLTVNALGIGATLNDSFTISSVDGTTVTVNITIEGANDPPTAVDDEINTGIEPGGTVTVLPVTNDSDPENDALTIIQIEGQAISAGGPAIDIGDGNLFQLRADGVTLDVQINNFEDEGLTIFNYTISDGNGGTATAVVTIGLQE